MQNANGNSYQTGDVSRGEYEYDGLQSMQGQTGGGGGSGGIPFIVFFGGALLAATFIFGKVAHNESNSAQQSSNYGSSSDNAWVDDFVRDLESGN